MCRLAAVALGLILAASSFAGQGKTHAPSPDARGGDVTLTVDVSSTSGRLKPLRGVNGAPDPTFLAADAQFPMLGAPMDHSALYREAHVSLVRTHDAQGLSDLDTHVAPGAVPAPLPGGFPTSPAVEKAVDLNVLFPNLAADPEKPENYNFAPTDKLIRSIRGLGAEVVFRLGREGHATTPVPTDLPRYANIVRHVVLHYNKGWANGMRDAVRYWEVWNEPDLGHVWWQGTPQQYYDLYAALSAAVKQADRTTMVGGPTIALVNEETPYREGFLAYARDHKLPLDFFSWHWYSVKSDDPYDFTLIGTRLRALLDRYGFLRTQSFLDEWNSDFIAARNIPEMQRAAFVASARIYMQDAPIDRDAFYRADTELGAHVTKVGRALIATGRLADTPLRLKTTGGDPNGLGILAGRSEDGRTIQVLVSNYEIAPADRMARTEPAELVVPNLFRMKLLDHRTVTYPARSRYRLSLAHLPTGRWTLERLRLDGSHDLVPVETRPLKPGEAELTGDVRAPMVELLILHRS